MAAKGAEFRRKWMIVGRGESWSLQKAKDNRGGEVMGSN